jgi:hypothetical protein
MLPLSTYLFSHWSITLGEKRFHLTVGLSAGEVREQPGQPLPDEGGEDAGQGAPDHKEGHAGLRHQPPQVPGLRAPAGRNAGAGRGGRGDAHPVGADQV